MKMNILPQFNFLFFTAFNADLDQFSKISGLKPNYDKWGVLDPRKIYNYLPISRIGGKSGAQRDQHIGYMCPGEAEQYYKNTFWK